MEKFAHISECGRYRWKLGRRWARGPALVFVMLNPSTADAEEDDPTIRKCIGFAMRNGFSAIEVVNLYAYRTKSPQLLRLAGHPGNDRFNRDFIIQTAWQVNADGGLVVCAWGANARNDPEAAYITALLREAGPVFALRLSEDGTPWHPLMLPYSCQLTRF